MPETTTRTITLTGRPPVRINEDDWPVIASARDKEHDGQVECQANCISKWSIAVRQHEDGRAVVYAVYDYNTNWRSHRNYSAKRGVLLPAGTTVDEICSAVRDVCDDIAAAEHDGEDASRWATLAAECIADLPAETL